MNQTARFSLICGAICVVAAYVAMHTAPPRTPAATHVISSLAIGYADREWGFQSRTDAPVPAKTAAHAGLAGPDFKSMFRATKNYFQLAHKLLPAAQGGDRNAQYYLYRTLMACTGSFLRKDGIHQKSTDEALRSFARYRNVDLPATASSYDRCFDLQENDISDLGSSGKWLALATAAEQPNAMIATANAILFYYSQHAMALINKAPSVEPTLDPDLDLQANTQELMIKSALSGDASALFDVGSAVRFSRQFDPQAAIDQLSLTLIACNLSQDCGRTADEYVMGFYGAEGHEDEIRLRAAVIKSQLDAGELDPSLFPSDWPGSEEWNVNLAAGFKSWLIESGFPNP